MNFGCFIKLLILHGYVCIVTSIHVCSNQTEFGKTVYLSHDESDATQCQCYVTSSKKLDSRIGFHKQWFSKACDFDFFVTVNSVRHTYSCINFEDKYFNLYSGNVATISLEPNSDVDLFDFNLAVHTYTDNATLILECYEQLNSEPRPTRKTPSDTPTSSSPVDNGTGGTGLNVGEIVGIVIGVIVLIILIVVIIVICFIKRKRDKTYESATRHNHDLHIYQSVTPDNRTRVSQQGGYDNIGMNDIVPELPIRDVIPTISDMNSNTVTDSSAPKRDTRTNENIQPSTGSSPISPDVEVDYVMPTNTTIAPAHPERTPHNDTEGNLPQHEPTVLGEDAAEYSKVTTIESSGI